MDKTVDVNEAEVEKLFADLTKFSQSSGYHLNPDPEFTKELIKSLLVNKKRYGYQACPCRLASGDPKTDLDITCPCDYRDADLNDHNSCYCGLYITEQVQNGTAKLKPIPERRVKQGPENTNITDTDRKNILADLPLPVWRCKVCGYLCARETPPAVCPICKAQRERFEKFL